MGRAAQVYSAWMPQLQGNLRSWLFHHKPRCTRQSLGESRERLLHGAGRGEAQRPDAPEPLPSASLQNQSLSLPVVGAGRAPATVGPGGNQDSGGKKRGATSPDTCGGTGWGWAPSCWEGHTSGTRTTETGSCDLRKPDELVCGATAILGAQSTSSGIPQDQLSSDPARPLLPAQPPSHLHVSNPGLSPLQSIFIDFNKFFPPSNCLGIKLHKIEFPFKFQLFL